MKITLHPWLNSALKFAMFYVLVMMDPLLMEANHPNSILIANNPTV